MKKIILVCIFFLSNFASANQELTLYFIPSPSGMDWSSPSSLVKTAAKNKFSFKSHFMGHVWVELKCGPVYELTGMTDHAPDYFYQLLVERRGLGILYHSFEGRLEKKEDILAEMPGLFKQGRINFVTFLLNSSQCQRASLYLEQYRKFKVDRFYGLAQRPRYGEGSGCSAFGASVADVLNFIDPGMKDAWSQTINIPLELAGAPVTDKKIGLHQFFFRAVGWAKEDEKHRKLFFWDPDKMFQWVKRKISEKHSDIAIKKIGNSEGIIMDKTIYPSPLGPIWLQQLNPKNEKETLIGP
jgi:hypothetical protein